MSLHKWGINLGKHSELWPASAPCFGVGGTSFLIFHLWTTFYYPPRHCIYGTKGLTTSSFMILSLGQLIPLCTDLICCTLQQFRNHVWALYAYQSSLLPCSLTQVVWRLSHFISSRLPCLNLLSPSSAHITPKCTCAHKNNSLLTS